MRKIELLKRTSNIGLIYILFNYWVTPLYFLLDKLFFNEIYFLNHSLFGNIEYIPYYITFVTFLLVLINLLSRMCIKEKNILKNSKFTFFKMNIDNNISFYLLLISIFLFFFSSGNYRYQGENSNLLFQQFNLLRSIVPYLLMALWFIRGNYFIKSDKKTRWYLNTIFYSACTLLLNNGLASILEFFAWSHQLFTAMDEKGNNLINYIFTDLKKNIKFSGQIKIKTLGIIITFIFLPYFINNVILLGHGSKLGNQKLREYDKEFNLTYYINTYFVKLGINRPEFFTVYKAPKINTQERVLNKRDLLQNINYRFNKLLGNEINDRGKTPHRTNLIHIANYEFKEREGTSPGLLSSFNYYFDPFSSIFIEMIYFSIACFFISLFEKQNLRSNHLRKFLVVFFILRELLCSPISLLMILDHYIILPFLLVLYFLLENNFIEKFNTQN